MAFENLTEKAVRTLQAPCACKGRLSEADVKEVDERGSRWPCWRRTSTSRSSITFRHCHRARRRRRRLMESPYSGADDRQIGVNEDSPSLMGSGDAN
jgi:hypothetical protein